MSKALGAALLVVGVILLYFGYTDYQSAASSLNQAFTGSPNNKALWLLIGGAASAVVGLVLLVLPSPR